MHFLSAEQAEEANFRPCKRCKPTNERLPDHEWTDLIKQSIDQNFDKPLTLQTLAEMCHGSPYHLLRTFKRIQGMTPAEYVRKKRINHAAECLVRSDHKVAEIARQAGIPNAAYFITLFKKTTGLTPNRFRQAHKSQ